MDNIQKNSLTSGFNTSHKFISNISSGFVVIAFCVVIEHFGREVDVLKESLAWFLLTYSTCRAILSSSSKDFMVCEYQGQLHIQHHCEIVAPISFVTTMKKVIGLSSKFPTRPQYQFSFMSSWTSLRLAGIIHLLVHVQYQQISKGIFDSLDNCNGINEIFLQKLWRFLTWYLKSRKF